MSNEVNHLITQISEVMEKLRVQLDKLCNDQASQNALFACASFCEAIVIDADVHPFQRDQAAMVLRIIERAVLPATFAKRG